MKNCSVEACVEMNTQRISQIDIKDKCLVYGWIRNEIERKFKIQNIPSVIKNKCILFHAQFDRFEKIQSPDRFPTSVEISQDKKCMKSMSDVFGHTYGLIELQSQSDLIAQWDLYIKKAGSYGLYIGVIGTQQSNQYVYGSDGCKRRDISREYGDGYITGDTISIKLNLKKREIKFGKNNKDQGVAFDNIDIGEGIKYRLLIETHYIHDSVEIMRYFTK